jgi:phosphate transport system substrate-binding protein
MTADVRAVPLALDAKGKMVPATPENAYNGEYGLSRFLLFYANIKPGDAVDPLRREFVRYVFSKQGQKDVVKDGYFPVTAKIAAEELAKVGVSAGGQG